ncbi:MAG: MFS transporter [Pseudomonadales bacterium]|nr:MFS transporter [Pseudomonadales bacterium]
MKHSKTLSNRYWLLLLLLMAYILSFIDRNIMAILVGPIRDDFAISDELYGWLNGVAFTFMYVILGVPIAWLADRKSRKNIIAVGTGIWSVMTFLCGMATGFNSFFFARMGVGVGEAALSPPAHSLLADYFSKEQLPTVMAIFTLGIPIGVGVSYSLGGWVYAWALAQGGFVLPLLGAVKPWQATFMIVGLPGLLVALGIFRVIEPSRTGAMRSKISGAEQDSKTMDMSLAQTWHFLWQRKSVYLPIFLAISCLSIVGYSFMMWFVAHASRVYDIPAFEIGKTFGLIYLCAGVAGTLFGALLSRILINRGFADAAIRVALLVAVLWLIPAIIVTHMPSLTWAYIISVPCIFCLNAYFGVSIAAIQIVTPNQMRAQASAVLLFFTNVFGLAVGPVIVGRLSSVVFSGDESLANALSVVAVVFCPLAVILFAVALKPYKALLQQAEQGWS